MKGLQGLVLWPIVIGTSTTAAHGIPRRYDENHGDFHAGDGNIRLEFGHHGPGHHGIGSYGEPGSPNEAPNDGYTTTTYTGYMTVTTANSAATAENSFGNSPGGGFGNHDGHRPFGFGIPGIEFNRPGGQIQDMGIGTTTTAPETTASSYSYDSASTATATESYNLEQGEFGGFGGHVHEGVDASIGQTAATETSISPTYTYTGASKSTSSAFYASRSSHNYGRNDDGSHQNDDRSGLQKRGFGNNRGWGGWHGSDGHSDGHEHSKHEKGENWNGGHWGGGHGGGKHNTGGESRHGGFGDMVSDFSSLLIPESCCASNTERRLIIL